MRLTIIGSVALDSIETPFGKRKEVLGGSATFSSLSASFFTPVNLISVVGTDFPKKDINMFRKKGSYDNTGRNRKELFTDRYRTIAVKSR